MFGFLKQIFISAVMLFGSNLPSVAPLKCILMNNQECKVRLFYINKLLMLIVMNLCFFPFSIKTSKCSGSCNTMNDLYANLGHLCICVPDVIKNSNVRAFILMSTTNETRHIEWHETCKRKCRLDGSNCNNKQRWNKDKCRSECKELIDKGVCENEFICNPSNCDCECDKSCDIGEYLDLENCKCRKNVVYKLVEECTENVEEEKLAKMTSA